MLTEHNKCVLLFSGGRDSTLAAVELAKVYQKLVLVTVTSTHLSGIGTVHNRLKELKRYLPEDTEWYCIKQPADLCTDVSFYAPTCLPCHHSYVVVGVLIAEQTITKDVAFGYTGYQSTWPEQTKLAITRLTDLLKSYNINLILPVYDIDDVEIVKQELEKLGLSPAALEQKCTRQITNIELESETLNGEINAWTKAMNQTLKVRQNIKLDIAEKKHFKDIDG